MGEIRIARDTRIDREVAIKLMKGAVADDEAIARFFREARVQGALEHPAMVPVHDLGTDSNDNPYFVMKKLAGTTLASVLDATPDDPVRQRFPRRTLLQRLADITHAVVFAHARGVIHRDLKPANIMLGDFGEAYVLDWGLARIVGDRESFRAVLPLSGDGETAVGALMGTPGYMAPEQARGEEVDAMTDVFALGMVLYEILAGVPALPRGLAAIDPTLSTREHRPSGRIADVPPELDDLCAHATQQEKKKRPSALAFVQALEAYLDGDRDLERRRILAEEYAASAEAEALRPDGRVAALQDAGRAIAMDPTNARAAAVLSRALLEAPDATPPEALAAADRERVAYRNQLALAGGLGFIGVGFLAPIVFFLEIKHLWPLVTLMCVLFGQGLLMIGTTRLNAPLHSKWFLVMVLMNVVIIASFGLIFGPLMLAPIILTGSLAGWLLVPSTYPGWLTVSIHVLAIVPLIVLEQVGVLPASFHVEGGGLVLTPWAVVLTPATTAIVMTFAIVGQQLYLYVLLMGGKRAQESAQNRIHTMKWHLEQVFSRGVEPAAPPPARRASPSPRG